MKELAKDFNFGFDEQKIQPLLASNCIAAVAVG